MLASAAYRQRPVIPHKKKSKTHDSDAVLKYDFALHPSLLLHIFIRFSLYFSESATLKDD